MTNWIPITKLLVQGKMTEAEMIAFTEIGLSPEQTPEQVLADAIEQVVDDARGYLATAVREGFLSSMGPSGTVPKRMVKTVCHIIRYEIATRLPGMAALIDELRQKQNDADLLWLKNVAKGVPSMDDPVAEETAVSAPSPSIKARRKQFSRDQQDGI